MRKEKILIVDDDPDIRDVLEITLQDYFQVMSATNGREALDMIKVKVPDIIITDYMMPVMNGPELCREIRKDILIRHVPIIMLTGKGDTKDIVGGIEAGADDYIIKPFEPDALLARIRMVLNRTIRSLDANPLTKLPGNTSIMDEMQARLEAGKLFAVGYADLDKFKIFNDKYGFEKGDEVIRMTARVLIQSVQSLGGENAFVGHVGGDDFIFICDDDKADAVCQRIVESFEKLSPTLYSDEDRQAGFIMGQDRQGNMTRAALMSISIGLVSNALRTITHVAQIGEIAAELKKLAKLEEKSNYVRDQRKNKN